MASESFSGKKTAEPNTDAPAGLEPFGQQTEGRLPSLQTYRDAAADSGRMGSPALKIADADHLYQHTHLEAESGAINSKPFGDCDV